MFSKVSPVCVFAPVVENLPPLANASPAHGWQRNDGKYAHPKDAAAAVLQPLVGRFLTN